MKFITPTEAVAVAFNDAPIDDRDPRLVKLIPERKAVSLETALKVTAANLLHTNGRL